MKRINFLNIMIDNVTMGEALEYINFLISQNKCSYVVTPNLDHIVTVEKDQEFAEIYRNADLVLADGQPLLWISRLKRRPIIEKVSGSDLFPLLCDMAAKFNYRLYILGSTEEVSQKAVKKLKQNHSGLQIAGIYSPPIGFEKDPQELERIIDKINHAKPHILAVALGSPKGEKFIYNYLEKLNVPLSISIGATIDFISGNKMRAPKWMSKCGFEWLFRFFCEPKRLGKRYLRDAIDIIPIIQKY